MLDLDQVTWYATDWVCVDIWVKFFFVSVLIASVWVSATLPELVWLKPRYEYLILEGFALGVGVDC